MAIQMNTEIEMLENEDLDLISDLPEPIKCQILLLLPTKIAVATSILSKRWNNIFPFAYPPIYLDLDDSLLLRLARNVPDSNTTNFRSFVNKLLFVTLRNVSRMEGMTLKCTKDYGDADIVTWVSAALRFNVQDLVLGVFLYKPKTLFARLNGCTTLVKLELVMNCVLLIPGNFSLPSLRRLYLCGLEFKDLEGEWSINELISSCPMLEDLEMVRCDLCGIFHLFIQSPLLKVISINKSWIQSILTILELHAPSLERFMMDDYITGTAIFSTFNSLFEAHIDVGVIKEEVASSFISERNWSIYTEVARIIVACSNSKKLYLSEYSILSLHYAAQQLPQFCNLISLSLGYVRSEGWMVLAGVLYNAPNLEHLIFEEGFEVSQNGYEDFKCLSLLLAPICLEMHLKRIELRHFQGKRNELELLGYFLQNGKVLEKVELNSVVLPIRDSDT